jgi:hypothetical protein
MRDPIWDPFEGSLQRLHTYVRTNGRRDGWLGGMTRAVVRNARDTDRIYLVGWLDECFVKLGRCSAPARWEAFVRRGGKLLSLYEPTHRPVAVAEAELHATIRAAGFTPAFSRKADAAPFLGGGGSGWTECYRIGEGKWRNLAAARKAAR